MHVFQAVWQHLERQTPLGNFDTRHPNVRRPVAQPMHVGDDVDKSGGTKFLPDSLQSIGHRVEQRFVQRSTLRDDS